MSELKYKSNLDEVLQRLSLFYERRFEDRVLAAFQIPSRTLEGFRSDHDAGFCDYPDPVERAAFWDDLLSERSRLEDDSLPNAYLSEFDQGLYGGLAGGEVRFMCDTQTGWISSMVPPLLKSWSEFDSLRPDAATSWLQRYLRQLQVFVERAEGKFGISHFILIDGLNFVFELMGATQTYTSLIENPDMVGKAMDFAFELNLKVQNTFFETVPALRGGTCSNMAQWLPGKVVSESVDPFHMTSPQYFEQWGREAVQKVFDSFDGGILHIHANGRHLVESVSSLRNLKAIYFPDDRGFPLSFDIVGKLKKRTGDVPVVVDAEFSQSVERLNAHKLTGGVFYNVSLAPGVDEANRCMAKVRSYRAD